MLSSRFIVRYASRKSFSLPSVNFQHAQREVEDGQERKIAPLYPVENKKEYVNSRSVKNKSRNENHNSGNNHDYSEIHVKRSSKELSKISYDTVQEHTDSRKFGRTDSFDKTYNERQKLKRKLEGKYGTFYTNKKEKIGEIIFGIHPILQALQAQRRKFHHLYYKAGLETTNIKIQEILELAKQHNVTVHAVTSSKLKSYIGEDRVHQGICCDVDPLSFEELEAESFFQEIKPIPETMDATKIEEKGSKKETYQLWLYMDRIQDPMNFGAILRSAYFMGVDRVLTSMENSCRLSGVVSKASAGAAELFPVYQVDNIRHLFEALTNDGWNLVSTAVEATEGIAQAVPLSHYEPNGNMLLAVGNEGLGISPDLQDMFKTTLTIQPGRILQPGMDSLNVSVATAIMLHTITSKIASLKI